MCGNREGRPIKASAFLLGGLLGIFISLYAFSAFIIDFQTCTAFEEATECTNAKGEAKNILQYNTVMNGGYSDTSNAGDKPTASDNYVSEVTNYLQCQVSETFGTNKTFPLERNPQRAQELCVLAGCDYKQCLKVKSTCADGTKKKMENFECVDAPIVSKITSWEFAFATTAGGLGGIFFIVGFFV